MKYLVSILLLLVLLSCKNKKKVAMQEPDVFYTCSMHPQIMQNTPGDCPICGMDLIKVEKKKAASDESIMLSDQQIQLGNI